MTAPPSTRVHLSFRDQRDGTASPPACLPDADAARAQIGATTRLAGPTAAACRVWSVEPCNCPSDPDASSGPSVPSAS